MIASRQGSFESGADAGELLRVAEFVERDEQASGESGDEKEIHFVEQDQFTDEAGLKNGGSGIPGIEVNGDGFADGVGADGALPAFGGGKMAVLEGKTRTEVIGGTDVIAVLHVPEIAFKTPAGPHSGQILNAGIGDCAGRCGPQRTFFDVKVLRQRDDG